MKSKLEKRMKKEARQISCPDLFSSIQNRLGIEEEKKVPFWNKRRIITFSTVGAMALVVAVSIPVGMTLFSEENTYSIVTLTINSSVVSSEVSSRYATKKLANNSSATEDTSDITISLYLENSEVVESSASDTNSQLILSGTDNEEKNVKSYVKSIVSAAIYAGFLDKTNKDNNISLLVYSDSEKQKSNIINYLGEGIISSLKDNYVYGYIIDEEALKSSDQARANELNIGVNKYKLIKKIISLYKESYTEEDLKSYTFDELKTLLIAKGEEALLTPPNLPEFDIYKQQFMQEIKEFMPHLEDLQKQINKLRNSITMSGVGIDKSYLLYDYKHYMMEYGHVPHEFTYYEKQNPSKNLNANENNLEVAKLISLIEESKLYIDTNIKPIAEKYKNNYMPQGEQGFKDEFDRRYNEFSNERPDEWKNEYNDYYNSDDRYWLKK
jgi:hypothetical protein